MPLLNAFGATQDVLPYAIEYTRITAVGMPLLIITNGMSNLARADGSPNYSMMCMLIGAIINTILDPLFILNSIWVSGVLPLLPSSVSFLFSYGSVLCEKIHTHPFKKTAFYPEATGMSEYRIPWHEQLSESGGDYVCSDCNE